MVVVPVVSVLVLYSDNLSLIPAEVVCFSLKIA